MMARLLRIVLSKGWLAIILLLGALGSSSSAVKNSIPNLRDAPLFNFVLFGTIAGWLLAKTRLRGWWALPLGLLLGAGAILYGFGGLGPPLLALARSSAVYIYDLLRWLVLLPSKTGVLPSAESIQLAAQEINNSSYFVIFRLYSWLNIGLHGHWMLDVLATSIFWSVVVCLSALWASWWVRAARNPILGVAPAGLLMAFTLNYTRSDSLVIVFFLGTVLLLLTLNLETVNEEHWKKSSVDFAEHIPQDVAISGILLTVIFILLASGAHAMQGMTFKDITGIFDRFRAAPANGANGESFAESMGLDQTGKKVSTFSEWNKAGLPRQHLLGSGPELSKRIVMVVTPDQTSLPPQIPEGGVAVNAVATAPRYYWRALTYDHYNGAGWTAEGIQETTYNAASPLVVNLPEGKQLIHASVRGVEDLANLLYYTGDLVSADKDYIVASRPIFQAPGAPLYVQKYVENDIFGARIQSQTYQFDSLLTYASEKSLRSSTSNYPEYIAARYMGLPAITPSRLFLLVINLTDNQPTQYDKALAIQNYLRNIPYSLDIPAPPADRDVADYFVFDLKKGYCDYYATAMVVMARAAGIPARLVMGYASGTYDPVNKSYVVTEADAHSWPELYFPNVGWVEFEPTASYPAIQRPPDLSPEQVQQAQQNVRRIRLPSFSWSGWLVRVGILLLALYILVDLWLAVDALRLRRMSPEEGIRRIYERLYRQARPLSGKNRPGETPLEYAAVLQGHISALKTRQREEYYFNTVLNRIRDLTNVYIQALFSPHVPGQPELEQAIQVWKRLRGELFSLRFRQMVRRIYENSKPWVSKSRAHRPQGI